MKMINYTLPEFVFLDGHSHFGDALESRTVLMHVRSCTVLEVVAIDDVFTSNFNTSIHEFKYKNCKGFTENHLFALHFTMEEDDNLPTIFEKCEKWYNDYLKWEDENIVGDEKIKNN